jgi:diketogulonate reductase-like aldo/keto reductase
LEYVRLGRRGPRVSIVGVGTWQAGGRLWLSVDTRSLEAAVLRAVGVGVNLFDTAELYGLVVNVGDEVKEGDVLLIVEAMKMANEVHAPVSGTVEEILVRVGEHVNPGFTSLKLFLYYL